MSDSIMFAGDTNIFNSHKEFIKLRTHKINQCFSSHKLSLNIKKKLFFHKRIKQDNISLLLPKLETNNE